MLEFWQQNFSHPYVEMMLFVCAAVVIVSIDRGKPLGLRFAGVHAGAWAVATGYVLITGSYVPWLLFLVLQFGAAWLITMTPFCRMTIPFAATYLAQAVLTVNYGFYSLTANLGEVVRASFFNSMLLLAFVQLGLLAIWGGYYGGGDRIVNAFRRRFLLARKTNVKGAP